MRIRFDNGLEQEFSSAITAGDALRQQNLGNGAIVAAEIDGRVVDLNFEISQDASLQAVSSDSPAGLSVLRHSTAHLLAQAVKRLYPEAKVAIGPVIEHGFYYDFDYHRPFTPEDLEQIEQVMAEIVAEDLPLSRTEMPHHEAQQWFAQQGETYKNKILADLPTDAPISLYHQGDFHDLCRGPHVPRTGLLGAFKLTRLAGAYWRGDSQQPMLQRIYGTAWPDRKALQQHLKRLAELERRDHRKLGQKMGLFHLQSEAAGMVFWHPHGWTLYRLLQDYIRQRLQQQHYQEVHSPQLLSRSLWERSGHWDKFQQHMFTTASERQDYAIKPMNCPGHVQIYNQGSKSYRDLPLRLAEFGSCHRNEPSGTLHGLMRLRQFVQDDAHIFCTEDQLQQETAAFLSLVFSVYRDFGFRDIAIALSTRPAQRVGDDRLWDKAEQALEEALRTAQLDFSVAPGEGAFYGPKIDLSLRDSMGRVWQCGTLQADFSMPERLGASYTAADGGRYVPVMLHRAILGSLERFIGILIEHHQGILPLWLAPVQGVLLNISERHNEQVCRLQKQLQEAGLRVEADLSNEKISYKIRAHSMRKVPYMLVVGDKELESGELSVRHCQRGNLGSRSPLALIAQWQQEIAERCMAQMED